MCILHILVLFCNKKVYKLDKKSRLCYHIHIIYIVERASGDMMLFKTTTSNTSRKDANVFAPSCSSAHKNTFIDVLAGIALAVSVFLFILRIDLLCLIIALNALIIIGKSLLRKKQFVG